MECKHCKSVLLTKKSLTNHIKTNKKCLEIQSKNKLNIVVTELLQCEYCNKSYSKSNLIKHLEVCKVKSKITIEKLLLENEKIKTDNERLLSENEKFRIQIDLLVSENDSLVSENSKLSHDNENIQELKNYIIKLETANDIYKTDHQTITEIAKQPKNTTNTNNNNIINNLSVYDSNEIKNRFSNAINDIKPADLYDGQKSLGRFIAPCLKNEDGTKMISCTDYARNVFVYKDKNGNINKDIKCKNLADLIEPIASAKADEMIKEDCNTRIKSFRLSSLKKDVIKRQEVILDLSRNLLGYKIGSSDWKMVNKSISEREKENERDRNEIEILEEEGIRHTEDICDTKLIDGANEIKDMTKDSSRFSKTLSECM
jgi:hypothetical protein